MEEEIRDMIEGDTYYRKRLYVSPQYKNRPIPYRALSELELWRCEVKSYEVIKDKEILKSLDDPDKLDAGQLLELTDSLMMKDYWIVFYAMKDFVEGLTFQTILKMKGVSALAKKISFESGIGREEEVKDF